MSSIALLKPQDKTAALPVEWLQPPVFDSDAVPGGSPGLLRIDAKVYMVAQHHSPVVGQGWTLTQTDGTTYFVQPERHLPGRDCNCPHNLHKRPALGCRHTRGLRQALAQLHAEERERALHAEALAASADADFWLEGEYDYTAPRAYFGDVVLFPARGEDKGPRPAA